MCGDAVQPVHMIVLTGLYSEYQCVCHTTQDGFSALMFAAWKGETEVCVELVKAGANVDMQNKV